MDILIIKENMRIVGRQNLCFIHSSKKKSLIDLYPPTSQCLDDTHL